MARNSPRKEKMLRLFEILRTYTDSEQGITMPEILERLESFGITAERKGIYDDIDVFKSLGYPIMSNKEQGKVYYHYMAHPFSLAELKLLVDMINASSVISDATSRDLTRKIAGLSSMNHTKKLKRVLYTNRTKASGTKLLELIDGLYQAMDDNRQIRMRYANWTLEKSLVDKGKVYLLSPWALIWNEQNYYLLAYDHDAFKYKHFRVDKIRSISHVECERSHPISDVDQYVHRHFGMYGGTEETLTLRFHKDLIGVIIDRFGKDISVHPKGHDQVEVAVKVILSQQFYAWIFGLRGGVSIISPSHARETYREMLEEALKSY